MDSDPVRLLVALRPREDARTEISTKLPDVGWCFLAEREGRPLDRVEAMLLGSVDRDLGPFDPAGLPELRFVQRVYAGLDGVPFGRFSSRVQFAGNVGAYAAPVADHALALALALARGIVAAQPMVHDGRLRPAPEHRRLDGTTALVLGYGEIGRAIASRLSGFDVRVIGLNRTGRAAPGCEQMFPADRLFEAVAGADLVFDARPLTHRTRGTIDSGILERMRPKAMYVNIGRAGTVDEEAVFRHLERHPEFRVGLDPWWGENPADDRFVSRFPFATLPNFVGTPHTAGLSPGTPERVLAFALENLARFFRGESPRHVVDRGEYEDPPASG